MILGIGTDILNPKRIAEALQRQGDAFLARIYTDAEVKQAQSRPARMIYTLATRFAAKEACIKALGARIGAAASWTDIEVVSLESGRPTLQLHNKAAAWLAKQTPMGYKARLHLSLSDAEDAVVAYVIAEAVRED